MQAQTKAQPGDKTMMDALVPAVDALAAAASAGTTFADAFADAALRRHRRARSERKI